MTTAQLRRQIGERARTLSEDRLRVVDDFLAYLQDRQDNDATRELLAIPGFQSALKKAEREVSLGKTVRWAKVRRHV